MTNFRRALLALITFITGVGLSLGVGAGIASAHAPVLTKTEVRPCGADATWTGTVTVKSDGDYNKDWQNKYTLDAGASTAYSAYTDDQVQYGPISFGPFPASKATAVVAVTSHWASPPNHNTNEVTNSGSITLNRPNATTCPTTVPGVTFTDPSCANQNTASVSGQLNTDKVTYIQLGNAAPGAFVIVTATPKTGYTFTPNPTVFTHTFTGIVDCTTHITVAVTFQDPACANQNTAAVIGAVDTAQADFTVTGTVAPGGTVTVTVVAIGNVTIDGTKTWTHTFTGIVDCTVHVTANVTFQDPTCANQNTAAVIGAVDTASIDFTVTGTVAPGGSVTVTAVAKAGYTLDGTASWSHTFTSAKDCTEHVTANVTFKDPTCADLSVAVIGAVDTTSIDFTITGTVAAGQSVTVTAVAKAGYTLDGTASWSHTFPSVPDCTTHVTANATFGDPTCASLTFTVSTTPVTGVTYITTGTPGPGATVIVSAAANAGYTLDGTNTWSHTYPGTPDCRIVSEPVAPFVYRSDVCEVKDQFQAGPTTGVVYSVTSGVLNQGQIVVIVATPAAGYKFAGEAQIVTYTVVGGTVQDCPIPVCKYNSAIPSDSPLCVPPTVDVPLPVTGGGTSGLTIGGILFGAGTLLTVAAFRRRKVRNA